MPPRQRPAVTWSRLLNWTRAVEIPDDAVVSNDAGSEVLSARRAGPVIYLEASPAPRYPALTWERLRTMCAEMGCQPGDELWYEGHFGADPTKVQDLGGEGGPQDDGRHYLILQRGWG